MLSHRELSYRILSYRILSYRILSFCALLPRLLPSRLYLSAVALAVMMISGCSQTPSPRKIVYTGNNFALEIPRAGHGFVADERQLYVFGGAVKNGTTGSIEIIDPKTRSIQVLRNHVTPRAHLSAVWDGKHSIYLIGGLSEKGGNVRWESDVEVFNTQTREVTNVAPLPFPTRSNTAVFYEGKIYVFGGNYKDWDTNRMKRSDIVAIFGTDSDAWSLGPPMPVGKETEAVIYNDAIYTVGGYDGRNGLASLDKYHPADETWTTLSSMPEQISAHSAAVIDDVVITFGDYEDKSKTLIYQFARDTWQEIQFGFTPARHSAAAVLDGTIYVTGGSASPAEYLNAIQIFTRGDIQQAIKKAQ